MYRLLCIWGDFDRESGGWVAVPILNCVYKMWPNSVLFLSASPVKHYVTRWEGMERQRFSMVHIRTNDMKDFGAVALPLTLEERRAVARELAEDDTLKECPFCGKPFSGLVGVKGHLRVVLKKPDDGTHDKEVVDRWCTEAASTILKVRRSRSKVRGGGRKRKPQDSDGDGLVEERENCDRYERMAETEERQPKKAVPAKKPKTIGISNKYERFGRILFDENEKEGNRLESEQ